MASAASGGESNFDTVFADIEDPNQRRRRALAEIDKASFSWRHARAVVVAGVGFFTVSYDIFAINLCSAMLGVVYWQNAASRPGQIPHNSDTAIKVATLGGIVFGQLLFGWLADKIGRKRMYGIELIIIILATLTQALASSSTSVSITGLFVFWRVIMGIGIGGGYPLSSVITSELAMTKYRGAMMGAVFAMQGFGQFGAAIVALIVTVCFKGSLESAISVAKCSGACQLAVDRMWRVVIGFGAVPACIALYYRLTIPETPRYTFDVARDIEMACADSFAYNQGRSRGRVDEARRVAGLQDPHSVKNPSWSDFRTYFIQWKNGKVLLGTAGSWFFLDVAFYGLGLNNSIILSAIGWNGGSTVYEYFYRNAVGNLILICAGAIPGYWVSVATVDHLGRKPIQLMGFLILAGVFIVLGFAYEPLKGSRNGLLALYVTAQFFFNFGPNTTTFIVPGECFPTRYRSTSHGISAASGKIGAIIAQCVFGPLAHKGAKGGNESSDTPWLNHVLQIFALFMLCGCFTSLLIPETKGKTLEVITGEEDSIVSTSHSNNSQRQSEPRDRPQSQVKARDRLWNRVKARGRPQRQEEARDGAQSRVEADAESQRVEVIVAHPKPDDDITPEIE